MIFVCLSRGLQPSPNKNKCTKTHVFHGDGERGGDFGHIFCREVLFLPWNCRRKKKNKKKTWSLLVAKENFRKTIESKERFFWEVTLKWCMITQDTPPRTNGWNLKMGVSSFEEEILVENSYFQVTGVSFGAVCLWKGMGELHQHFKHPATRDVFYL